MMMTIVVVLLMMVMALTVLRRMVRILKRIVGCSKRPSRQVTFMPDCMANCHFANLPSNLPVEQVLSFRVFLVSKGSAT